MLYYNVYTVIIFYTGEVMKVTRRSDKGKGGHLLISVPAKRVATVEAALTFLEKYRQMRGSHVVIDLIVRSARRNGWKSHDGVDDTRPQEGVV